MMWTFTKMHGAGNDFVVLDGMSQPIDMTPERARALADRHFGIGADQVLLVEAPSHPEADFRYRIFNADGGEVEHCGNGARCFVRFVHEKGLSRRNPLRAEIATGILVLLESGSGEVTADMGETRHGPEAVGFDPRGLDSTPCGVDTLWKLPMPGGDTAELSLVGISNPHAVQVVDRHTIRLRVYERGAGETLACGTGACAAAVAGIRRGLLDTPVRVHTRGGVLEIDWQNDRLHMTGPATTVFHGTVDIDALVRQQASLSDAATLRKDS